MRLLWNTYGVNLEILDQIFLELLCSQNIQKALPLNLTDSTSSEILSWRTSGISVKLYIALLCSQSWVTTVPIWLAGWWQYPINFSGLKKKQNKPLEKVKLLHHHTHPTLQENSACKVMGGKGRRYFKFTKFIYLFLSYVCIWPHYISICGSFWFRAPQGTHSAKHMPAIKLLFFFKWANSFTAFKILVKW